MEEESTEIEKQQEQAEQAEQTEQEQQSSENDLQKLVNDVKNDYETKIEKINLKYQKQLAERDNLIKQLLNGEEEKPFETIADKINKTRIYKKW